jgi:hypothetical protein
MVLQMRPAPGGCAGARTVRCCCRPCCSLLAARRRPRNAPDAAAAGPRAAPTTAPVRTRLAPALQGPPSPVPALQGAAVLLARGEPRARQGLLCTPAAGRRGPGWALVPCRAAGRPRVRVPSPPALPYIGACRSSRRCAQRRRQLDAPAGPARRSRGLGGWGLAGVPGRACTMAPCSAGLPMYSLTISPSSFYIFTRTYHERRGTARPYRGAAAINTAARPSARAIPLGHGSSTAALPRIPQAVGSAALPAAARDTQGTPARNRSAVPAFRASCDLPRARRRAGARVRATPASAAPGVLTGWAEVASLQAGMDAVLAHHLHMVSRHLGPLTRGPPSSRRQEAPRRCGAPGPPPGDAADFQISTPCRWACSSA